MARNFGDAILVQLVLQDGQRVNLGTMAGASLDDLSRFYEWSDIDPALQHDWSHTTSNKAVATYRAGIRRRLEQKRVGWLGPKLISNQPLYPCRNPAILQFLRSSS